MWDIHTVEHNTAARIKEPHLNAPTRMDLILSSLLLCPALPGYGYQRDPLKSLFSAHHYRGPDLT